jgi:predicted DNA-binding WGR domain protein
MGTKVNKKLADFEGQDPAYKADLEYHDPSENHNKFWHVRVYGRFVVRHWGRHGTKGQQMCEDCGWDREAVSAARDMANKKRSEGYTEEVSVLDRFAREIET